MESLVPGQQADTAQAAPIEGDITTGDVIGGDVIESAVGAVSPTPVAGDGPSVDFRPYLCPVCKGEPVADGCHECARYGLTDDVAGWPAQDVIRAPRPPAVMKKPCVDCAFRAGSPEQECDYELNGLRNPNRPFFCHTGLPLLEGRYRSVAQYQPCLHLDPLPLGAMVCAGWWDWREAGTLPTKPYRELHPED